MRHTHKRLDKPESLQIDYSKLGDSNAAGFVKPEFVASSSGTGSGITPPLSIGDFAEAIGYTVAGVYRLMREGRLPDGTSFRVGSLRKFCPERAAAIARGQLKILSTAEACAKQSAGGVRQAGVPHG